MTIIIEAKTNNELDEFRACKQFHVFKQEGNDPKELVEIVNAESCNYIVGKIFQLIDLDTDKLIVKEINDDDRIVLENAEIPPKESLCDKSQIPNSNQLKKLQITKPKQLKKSRPQ